MFCTQCGKQNREGASYCIYCGNKLLSTDRGTDANICSNDAPKTVAENNTVHMPLGLYRKFGGWLAVLSYGRLVSAVLELMACIAVIFNSVCFKYFPNGNREFIGFANFSRVAASKRIIFETILCYGGVLMLFLCLFHVCACVAVYRKIKKKKTDCIGFYRGITVLISCAVMAGLVAGFFLIKHNSFSVSASFDMRRIMPIVGAAVCLLMDVMISFLVFSTYFKTSVRAKFYFDTKQ